MHNMNDHKSSAPLPTSRGKHRYTHSTEPLTILEALKRPSIMKGANPLIPSKTIAAKDSPIFASIREPNPAEIRRLEAEEDRRRMKPPVKAKSTVKFDEAINKDVGVVVKISNRCGCFG